MSSRSGINKKRKRKILQLEQGLRTSRDVFEQYREQKQRDSKSYVTQEKRALSQRRLKSNENIKNLMNKQELNDPDVGFMTHRLRVLQGQNFESEKWYETVKERVVEQSLILTYRNCDNIYQSSTSNQIRDAMNQYERYPMVNERIKKKFLEHQNEELKYKNSDQFKIQKLETQLKDLKNTLANLKLEARKDPTSQLAELKEYVEEVKEKVLGEQVGKLTLNKMVDREKQQILYNTKEFNENTKAYQFCKAQIAQCDKDRLRLEKEIKTMKVEFSQFIQGIRDMEIAYENRVDRETSDFFKVDKYLKLRETLQEKVKEEETTRQNNTKNKIDEIQKTLLKQRIRQGILKIQQEKKLEQNQKQFELFRQKTNINDVRDLKDYVYNFQKQIENLDVEINQQNQSNEIKEQLLQEKKNELSELKMSVNVKNKRKDKLDDFRKLDQDQIKLEKKRERAQICLAMIYGFIQRLTKQLRFRQKQEVEGSQQNHIEICDLNTNKKKNEGRDTQTPVDINKSNAVEQLSLIGIKLQRILLLVETFQGNKQIDTNIKNNFYHELYNCQTFGLDKQIFANFQHEEYTELGIFSIKKIVQILRGGSEDKSDQKIRDDLEEHTEFEKQYRSLKNK